MRPLFFFTFDIGMYYSIIIPIHNEESTLAQLLYGLQEFSKKNHEIIIIDDGSTDDSSKILKSCGYIRLISLEKNLGKGAALKIGLEEALHNKIIIFDGDMEIELSNIHKLMKLNKKNKIDCVLGNRFDHILPFASFWDFGNLFFTIIFNIKNNCKLRDSLCCAKAFYKSDLDIKNLKSIGFDIDIELATILVKKSNRILIEKVNYERRTIEQGKKLKIADGWTILRRILT